MMQDEANQALLKRAASWMESRGWRQKLAKEKQYQQTLFEHSLNELDVTLRLLSILARRKHMHLSLDEQRVLQAAVLAHDVGKETDDFQEYIAGRLKHASHIDPDRTRRAVPEVCEALGFGDVAPNVIQVIESCINVHHPSPAGTMRGVLEGMDRWWPLARVVMAVDHVCSAAGLLDAREALERDMIGQFVRVSYHQVAVRGVSTTLLHRAAEEAFEEAGWIPLLCFANGTLYVADGAAMVSPPSTEDITARLRQGIDRLLSERDLSGIVVGSPIASILPKPELLDFTKTKSYLTVASKRVRRGTFIKKKMEDRRRVVSSYLNLVGRTDEPLTDDVIAREAARIDAAQPEMVVFKLFKALTSQTVLGNEGAATAAAAYDELLGAKAWDHLQSTSTLMPANDLAYTVDPFWKLSGERFGLTATRMEEVEPEERTRRLVQALTEIVSQAREAADRPSPVETLGRAMAAAFANDLVSPAVVGDPRTAARSQVETYARSKATAGKRVRKAVYLCPLCSRSFNQDEGEPASADFIAKPESHTNRALAHGPFDRIVICNGCRCERVLLQVLVGRAPAQVLVLLPRMNIGRGAGALLIQKVRDWVTKAQGIMSDSSTSGVTLGLTNLIAGKLGDELPEAFSSDDLARVVTFRISDDTRKRRLRELTKALTERYEDDLDQANREWDAAFASWEEAARALMDEELTDSDARALRREVLRQFPTLHFMAETPNLLLLPLTQRIAADENESAANRGLRELFVLLLIGMVFDTAVLTMNESDPIQWTGGEGIARVPPVPAVRSLIASWSARANARPQGASGAHSVTGDEWIQLTDAPRVLRAIGAAARLATACKFSPRSNLLQVLTESPPERILARIEQSGVETPSLKHVQLSTLR